MAMRLFTEAEFHEELRNRGFEPTDEVTETGRFWRHAASGKHTQVPDLRGAGRYPDYILDSILERFGELYAKPACAKKTYEVHEDNVIELPAKRSEP